MRTVLVDIRLAGRRLRATPLLTLGAVVTLALGIGATVVTVDVLDRLLLRPPAHVPDPDRVARVYTRIAAGSYMELTGYSTFEALEPLREDFEAIAVYFNESLSLGRGREARRLESVAYGPSYFAVLGLVPALGSLPDPSQPSEDAAVISYGLWQREFGGSRDVLGKPLRLGVDTYTVAAVAPRGFAGIGFKAVDVWLPFARRAGAAYGTEWKQAFFLYVIGRLRPDVNREQASDRATAAYRATRTQQWEQNNVVVLGDVRAARAPGERIGRRVEVLIAGMAVLVLLITCGNVANILLVRGLRRDREFVVKTALGATRVRLLGEVLIEAALLAAGAGTVTLLVVTSGGTLIREIFLSPVAALAGPIDARLVLITVLFCAAATFVLGLTPAFRLTTRLALAPGYSTARRPSRALDLFSGLQVALSLPLMVAAAVFTLSLWNAQHQDFGMETDKVAVVTTNLFEIGRPWETHAAHRQVQARLERLPQVDSTALVLNLPMQGATSFLIRVPGREEPQGPVAITDTMPIFNWVDPSFFRVMGMRVLDGRVFNDQENREGAASVAVITESMARDLWPGERAVGKCFYMSETVCTEVIGVLADARLHPSIRPTRQWASACYLPIERGAGGSWRTLLVRTNGDPAGVPETLRREAQTAAADLPYVSVHAFDDIYRSMLRPWRLGSIVFAIFGSLSMVIAGVGLAVVAAYGVTRRTREIGIRSALGARPRALVRLVITRSVVVILGGVAAGLGLAWASGRMLGAHVFGMEADDPRVLGGVALGLLVIGVLAAWMPARHAARIDPVKALRVE